MIFNFGEALSLNNDRDIQWSDGVPFPILSTFTESPQSFYVRPEDVRAGVVYQEIYTGLLDLPAEADVKLNVVYDNLTKTGTYVAPAAQAIADAVWATLLSSSTTPDSFGDRVTKLLTLAQFLGLK